MTKIIIFTGSVRTGSINQKLAKIAELKLRTKGVEATHISLADYELPLYNGDIEEKDGIPNNAIKLASLITEHHGVLIISPEYNSAPTPLLKNTLDWMSRINIEQTRGLSVYRESAYAIASATPGPLSGVRGLIALRTILSNGLSADVIPQQVGIGNAGRILGDDDIKDERTNAMFDNMLEALIQASKRFSIEEKV